MKKDEKGVGASDRLSDAHHDAPVLRHVQGAVAVDPPRQQVPHPPGDVGEGHAGRADPAAQEAVPRVFAARRDRLVDDPADEGLAAAATDGGEDRRDALLAQPSAPVARPFPPIFGVEPAGRVGSVDGRLGELPVRLGARELDGVRLAGEVDGEQHRHAGVEELLFIVVWLN